MRVAAEPPFRLMMRPMLKRLGCDLQTRMAWDLSSRPAYLLGVGTAALRAKAQGLLAITAIEFGVAAGNALLILEEAARPIQRETGVGIHVIGFDMGGGLPRSTGDYRDHPDYWQAGDFPMDEARLRAKLSPSTQLVIGDVRDTVRGFVAPAPIGFISFDLDLYSSTAAALTIFTQPGISLMRQVALYFDDIEAFIAHRRAGELLAIEEFNSRQDRIVIDRWHRVKAHQVFPEREYLNRMYVAHDLAAISETVLNRDTRHLTLDTARMRE
jgi:hypothetical protein